MSVASEVPMNKGADSHMDGDHAANVLLDESEGEKEDDKSHYQLTILSEGIVSIAVHCLLPIVYCALLPIVYCQGMVENQCQGINPPH